jgi:hypothetical protein
VWLLGARSATGKVLNRPVPLAVAAYPHGVAPGCLDSAHAESGRLAASATGPVSDLDAPFPGRGCCDDPRVTYVGRVGHGSCGKCEDPRWLMCTCGAEAFVRCNSSRRSRCRSCAAIYRGRVAAVAEGGLAVAPVDGALMVSVTAPGNVLHFRQGAEGEAEMCPCTGLDGVDLAEFNASVTARWNRFLEALRRGEASPGIKGRRVHVGIEYFNAREVQKRGAIHCHSLFRRTDGKPLQLAKRRVRELAIRHGFGHEVQVEVAGLGKHARGGRRPGRAVLAARYCAKYVSKSADERERAPWPSEAPGACWRTWTSSRRWGSSMREVREAARARAIAGLARGPGADALAAAPDRAGTVGLARPGAPLDSLTESYAEERGLSPPISVPWVLVRAFGQCEGWASGPKVGESEVRSEDPGTPGLGLASSGRVTHHQGVFEGV